MLITSRSAGSPLDATNLEILRHLTVQPSLAIRELARRVDMSAPAVNERVLRLKDTSVIKREWLEIDPQALGLTVTADVRVRPMPGGSNEESDANRDVGPADVSRSARI